jgi:hypothetical protein
MVRAEMKTFAKQDYLSSLPAISDPTFGGSAVLQAEYARIAAVQRSASEGDGGQVTVTRKGVSTQHYTSSSLPENEEDADEWKDCLAKARIRLEAQCLHSVNLELLGKYGAAAWKGHASEVERSTAATQGALKRLQQSSDDVNAARRSSQSHKAPRIQAAKAAWTGAVDSSFQLKVAIAELQGRVHTMRSLAQQRGLQPPADADGDSQLS